MAFGLGKKEAKPEDDLKRLSKAELLELLIDQTRLVERLKARNKELAAELAECKADLKRTASLEIILTRLEKLGENMNLPSGSDMSGQKKAGSKGK